MFSLSGKKGAKMDEKYENEGTQTTGKLTVFGHEEWFINNPKVDVYSGGIFLGAVARNEVKTFDVAFPATIQFKYSIRSAEIYMDSPEMRVELAWDRMSGKLLANQTSRKAPEPSEDGKDTESETAGEKKTNNHHGRTTFFIILGIIVVFTIIGIAGSRTKDKTTPTNAGVAVKSETAALPAATEAPAKEENKYIVAADNNTGAEFNITLDQYLEELNAVEKEYGFQRRYSKSNLKSGGTEQAKNTKLTIYLLEIGRTENTAVLCIRVNQATNRIACVDLSIDSAAIVTEHYYDSQKPDTRFYFNLAFRWIDNKFDVIRIQHLGSSMLSKGYNDYSIVTDVREGDFIILTGQCKEYANNFPIFRYRTIPYLESLVNYTDN